MIGRAAVVFALLFCSSAQSLEQLKLRRLDEIGIPDDPSGPPPPPPPPPKPVKPKPRPALPDGDPILSDDVFEQKLYAQNGAQYQKFGSRLAIHDQMIAASIEEDANGFGKVYVFDSVVVNSSVQYMEAAQLSGLSRHDGYGQAMAISEKYLVVGMPYSDTLGYMSGGVVIYDVTSETGTFSNSKSKTVFSSAPNPLGATFGSSVSLVDDVLAVGAPLDSTIHQFAGMVYIFHCDSTQGTWNEAVRLFDGRSSMPFLRFGAQVALLSSSSLAVAATGASELAANAGAVYFFHNTEDSADAWEVESILTPPVVVADGMFGYSMTFQDQVGFIAGYTETFSGIVYVYRQALSSQTSGGSKWVLKDILAPLDASNKYNSFGHSLSLRTLSLAGANSSEAMLYSVAVVGAPGDITSGTEAGAIYVYANALSDTSSAVSWKLVGKYMGNDTSAFSSYGFSVGCTSDGSIMVGAILANTPVAAQSGAVYVEHHLADYLVTQQYNRNTTDGGGSSSGSSSGNTWEWLHRMLTSSASIVGMACLPSAVFVAFVLLHFNRHKLPWLGAGSYESVATSKPTIASGEASLESGGEKPGNISDGAASGMEAGTNVNATQITESPMEESPLEKVLNALHGDELKPRNQSYLSKKLASLSSYVPFLSRFRATDSSRRELMGNGDGDDFSSCHSAGGRSRAEGEWETMDRSPGREDDDDVENPLRRDSSPAFGTGSAHLAVMAMETDARKRELLDRMHKLMNKADTLLANAPRRRVSESNLDHIADDSLDNMYHEAQST